MKTWPHEELLQGMSEDAYRRLDQAYRELEAERAKHVREMAESVRREDRLRHALEVAIGNMSAHGAWEGDLEWLRQQLAESRTGR